MKVLGFIAEYNPFHKGHKYHLEKSKEITESEFTIAIISGSFLQRGEPSFIDKWTKAKMAIDNGIDLVIELPFCYSTQSAEYFAYGGVKLLDSLKIVDYLSFGSELGELEPLAYLSSILYQEPSYYKERLKNYLNKGLSFPVSRSKALEDYIYKDNSSLDYDFQRILKESNNILGIEYLKALLKINSKIIPVTIKRIGSDYKNTFISASFSSATAIRHGIIEKGLNSIENFVPADTYYWLEKYIEKYGSFNYISKYEDILIYLLRTKGRENIKKLIDLEDGLENRIIEKGSKSNNIDQIIDSIASKRYPKTRIQRILTHLLHNFLKEDLEEIHSSYPSYIRVLGSNSNGFILLNKIKKNSSLPIITKFADYKQFKNKEIEKSIYFDKKSTDIFFLGLKGKESFYNMDYYTSPYIK